MQKGLKLISLQGAIVKSPILLSQYWKNEWLDGNIIISYFGGSNKFSPTVFTLAYIIIHLILYTMIDTYNNYTLNNVNREKINNIYIYSKIMLL